MKSKPRWFVIIIAIAVGVILMVINITTSKNRTSTTTTPKASPAVSAQPASGNALSLTIDSPRENEIVESGTINVTGRVSATGSQNVSGTAVTVSIKAGQVALGTTDQRGSFSVPIQLLLQDNHMDIKASQGTRIGSATRTCFYSCDPETYKAACMPLDYASLINSADAHKYERCSFNGRVYSSGSSMIYMDTAYRDGEWTDRVAVTIDVAQTAFPGDIIQVWGEVTGQVTEMNVRMPEFEAAYVEPVAE